MMELNAEGVVVALSFHSLIVFDMTFLIFRPIGSSFYCVGPSLVLG
jgi:hypothetical protein